MNSIGGIAPQADTSGVSFRYFKTDFERVIYFTQHHRWNIETVNERAHLQSLK
jgi:hypothetical protein